MMPKSSILTGWQFGTNPWQYATTTVTTLAAQTAYVADQTIVHQQDSGGNIDVGRDTAANNYGFNVVATATANQFALIQYIDPKSIRPYWGNNLATLVKGLFKTATSPVTIKARLIYRVDLPATISSTEPISSWSAGGDPGYAAGWSEVVPLGDPTYTLSTAGDFNLEFLWRNVPASSADNMTMGIVIYTTTNMDDGGADALTFHDISLVPNDFAIESNVLTAEEQLRRCQYYYEMSYASFADINTTTLNGCISSILQTGGGAPPFEISFKQTKRSDPTLTFYSANTVSNAVDRITTLRIDNLGNETSETNRNAPPAGTPVIAQQAISHDRALYYFTTAITIGGTFFEATRFHYLANSRLGA
jgi:hypothetical protein